MTVAAGSLHGRISAMATSAAEPTGSAKCMPRHTEPGDSEIGFVVIPDPTNWVCLSPVHVLSDYGISSTGTVLVRYSPGFSSDHASLVHSWERLTNPVGNASLARCDHALAAWKGTS